MSPTTASCPGCGATLEFRNAASLFAVCPYCGGASVREGVDWTLLGKVAAVADIDSVVSPGAMGRMDGRPWRVVGRIQLDHGSGPWNEWCLAFEDREADWAWLAEAQGELYLTRAAKAAVPPLEEVEVEQRVDLGAAGRFVVAEIGSGKVVAVQGELPVRVVPGSTVDYVDLRGPGGAFATIDYGVSGKDEGEPAVYVGRVVAAEALGIDAGTVVKAEPKQIRARRLACPSCAGTIELRDPKESVRVTCPSCGSLLDPTREPLSVVGKGRALAAQPAIPIGLTARLRDLDVEVYAYLVRSVRVAGRRYPWEEYLLKAKGRGWRWLVCSGGHWTFVEPANLGDVTRGTLDATYRGYAFRHFQGGEARVDHVQGEVYWEVEVGETVRVDDFVSPPRMLSFEGTGKERVVSLGTYLPVDELQAAFPRNGPLAEPEGDGAIQPNPYVAAKRRWWRTGFALAGLTLLLMVFFHARAARARVVDKTFRTVLTEDPVSPTGEPPPGSTGAVPAAASVESDVAFSDEFTLTPASSNLRVEFREAYDNLWSGLDASLVDVDTGEVTSFEVEAEHWSGVEDGESWSEGDRDGTAWLGDLPAGRYAFRFEPSVSPWPKTGPASLEPFSFHVTATNQVASTGKPLLLILLLLVPPLFVSIASRSFETRRWAESDHPIGGGGGDDDEEPGDDDEDDEDDDE